MPSSNSSTSSTASSTKKRRRKLFNDDEALVDKISSLPDSILCHILSFLPTAEAVGTSIVSRRWLHLWNKVPSFRFTDDKFISDDDSTHFDQFVNKVLLLNNSQPINSFQLCCGYCDPSYLRTWVSTAIDRNVLELDFTVDEDDILFQVPSKLLNCGTLESLALEGDISANVPSFVCLPRLTRLKLNCIRYATDECIQNLLSGCPMLKDLYILRGVCDNDNVTRFRISSPVLKSLFLQINLHPFHEIHNPKLEIDAPALEDLFILGDLFGDITVQMEDLTSLNSAQIILHCEKFKQSNSVVRPIEGLSCEVSKFHK